MSCTEWATGMEALRAFAFRDAVFCHYQDPIGGAAFALLVMGAVGMYIMGKTDSYALVAVVIILIGGMFLPYIAPVGLNFGLLIVLLLLGLTPLFILWRLARK